MPSFAFDMITAAVAVAGVLFSAVSNDASVVQRLDQAFSKRADDGGLQRLDEATRAALKDAPDDYEVLWRAARDMFWQADSSSDPNVKRRFGKEGWDIAERAVQAAPDKPEGHYYLAICAAAYGEGAGIWKALTEGIERVFLSHIDKAMELNANAERGGPMIAKARYYHQMPWPKRDLSRAEKLYEEALKSHPENLRAWYYLAQTQLKKGDAKAANDSISQVYSRDASYDPAEGGRIKNWAKHTQEQIQQELR